MKNRNSKMKKLIIVSVVIIFCLILVPKQSFAGSDDIRVKAVYRISHPAYTMNNIFYGEMQPFNVDYSRVMMYEWGGRGDSVEYTSPHPNFPSAKLDGRHMMWGCLTQSCVDATSATSTLQAMDLDNIKATDGRLAEWAANTLQFPTNYAIRMRWSPYSGESNIVYALNRNSKKLVTYNVDTGAETELISYDNVGGVTTAEILGFTKDAVTGSLGHQHEIIIKLRWGYGTDTAVVRIFTDRQGDGSFGASKQIIAWENMPSSCDARVGWYPDPQISIHGAVSPDGFYDATYWGVAKNDFDGDSCLNTDNIYPINADRHWKDDDMYSGQLGLTHVSWFGSNDWFIEGSENTLVFQTIGSYPEIITSKIYQVSFNRTLADLRTNNNCSDCFGHNLLISRSSAAIWYSYSTYSCTKSSDCSSRWPYTICGSGNLCRTSSIDYSGMSTPTIGIDGLHLYFHGTNGKYSRDDKGECTRKPTMTNCNGIGDNWEGLGAYIAELSPVSDITPPSPPIGLIII
jgi:hypothetical protein